jgi:hypothetical protein
MMDISAELYKIQAEFYMETEVYSEFHNCVRLTIREQSMLSITRMLRVLNINTSYHNPAHTESYCNTIRRIIQR